MIEQASGEWVVHHKKMNRLLYILLSIFVSACCCNDNAASLSLQQHDIYSSFPVLFSDDIQDSLITFINKNKDSFHDYPFYVHIVKKRKQPSDTIIDMLVGATGIVAVPPLVDITKGAIQIDSVSTILKFTNNLDCLPSAVLENWDYSLGIALCKYYDNLPSRCCIHDNIRTAVYRYRKNHRLEAIQ